MMRGEESRDARERQKPRASDWTAAGRRVPCASATSTAVTPGSRTASNSHLHTPLRPAVPPPWSTPSTRPPQVPSRRGPHTIPSPPSNTRPPSASKLLASVPSPAPSKMRSGRIRAAQRVSSPGQAGQSGSLVRNRCVEASLDDD